MSTFHAQHLLPRALVVLSTSVALASCLTACRNEIGIDQPGSDLEIRESPRGPGQPETGEPETPGPGTVITNPGEPETGGPGEPETGTPGEPEPAAPSMKESTKADLVWKRYRAVEQDLMRGLALDKDEVCNELGRFACIDSVHLAPLGGNEPFEQSQYEPVSEPTSTTAVAFERTVLAACAHRVDADKNGTPQVFTNIDLDATALNPDDTATAAAIDADMTTLYRNLLSRNPEADELASLREMARDDGTGAFSGSDFAKAACLAVGSSVESLFY